MKENTLQIADELIVERFGESLSLINGIAPCLLVIHEGADFVEELLRALGKKQHFRCLDPRLQDEQLLNLLMDHNIIHITGQAPSLLSKEAEHEKKITLYLDLTNSCNLSCSYCFARGTDNGLPTRMAPQTALRAIEAALSRVPIEGELEIVYFGGEPLLNWELVKLCFTHCQGMGEMRKSKRIHHHITTNLTIMPDDFIPQLRKFGATVLVNIDGPESVHNRLRPFKQGHGSFSTIINNIRKLKENRINFSLRATITSLNVNSMMSIAELFAELGSPTCDLPVYVPFGPGIEQSLALLPDADAYADGLIAIADSGYFPFDKVNPIGQFLDKVQSRSRAAWNCGLPRGTVPSVATDGKTYSCIYLKGLPEYSLGNITDVGSALFDAQPQQMLRYKYHVDSLEDCRSCRYRYLCGGGCPILRLSSDLASSIDHRERLDRYRRNIVCSLTKRMVTESLRRVCEKTAPVGRK